MYRHETNPLAKMGLAAKESCLRLAALGGKEKNALLQVIADALEQDSSDILTANAKDMSLAREQGMSPAMQDRLALDEARLASIAGDVRAVCSLPDPVGEIIDGRKLDSGLSLIRRRTPLGVVAAIYEARPNVTVDIAALCLKTGNAVILRGGKETVHSNAALTATLRTCLAAFGLPMDAVQSVPAADRELVTALLHLDNYVDMLIPRGGPSLHRLCREESRIPVITGGIGVCHIVVDASADLEKSLTVIENAKLQRPSVCNSVETVLVHKDAAAAFLPMLAGRMLAQGSVLHASPEAMNRCAPSSAIVPVQDGDYDKEWLCADFNLHVVTDLDEALAHIRKHGTGHSEAILTETRTNAERFANEVDASVVYINASTRFTDGGQFALGAEVAISTQKLHARGPMGLEALTTYKWIAAGDYTVRA